MKMAMVFKTGHKTNKVKEGKLVSRQNRNKAPRIQKINIKNSKYTLSSFW